jgi:hypothetical protein
MPQDPQTAAIRAPKSPPACRYGRFRITGLAFGRAAVLQSLSDRKRKLLGL